MMKHSHNQLRKFKITIPTGKQLNALHPQRFVILDAGSDADTVAQAVFDAVATRLMSQMTLKNGIERLLLQEVPGLKAVEAV